MREIHKLEPLPIPATLPRKRVAAYARVSSDKDAMQDSLTAQVEHFTSFIQSRADWEFAGVYTDLAYTGTKTERPGFQRLMADCRAGMIDGIVTKSISRFARNTLSLLETVRELKELGIGIWFQRENIHTLSGDGELMLSVLASFAQEESKSVSDNCKWRIRSRFKKGELVNLRFLYGYRIRQGSIEIDPVQAEVVRGIFRDYIGGFGGGAIAAKLRAEGSPTMNGGTWNMSRVLQVITQEKYAGNALLQKEYVPDHMTKRSVRNKGEVEMVFAEGTHPAIIDPATFDAANAIRRKRRERFVKTDAPKKPYPFTGILRCAACGKNYKRKTTHSKVSWICGTYEKLGAAVCPSKQIPEDTLITVSVDVLGLASFDAGLFHASVAEIIVPGFNRLVFVFRDGTRVERTWADRSRRESWTDEMKLTARERESARKGCTQ
jgi:DNA invertase Pin-like site-specific DNA recombinase